LTTNIIIISIKQSSPRLTPPSLQHAAVAVVAALFSAAYFVIDFVALRFVYS